MFDLEQAIVRWREQMAAGDIRSPDVLNELEAHLRDHVADQTRAGVAEAQAYEIAAAQLGPFPALESEFKKLESLNEMPERLRNSLLTFAGIPNHYTTMNAASIPFEPRWVTYLKATTFLLPSVCLWLLAIVFLIPKLEQICSLAGGAPLPGIIQVMIAITRNGYYVSGGILLVLVLLEWRSSWWPGYRRAMVATATFILNAAILITIFMMVVAAIVAAPALMQQAR